MKQNLACPTFLPLSLFLFFLFFSNETFSQCAGEDTSLSICDIASNQFVNLFDNLNGNPVSGGIWDNPSNPGIGIDPNSGVVVIWQIIQSGIYSFTYTVNSGTCDDVSVFTLTVGGYAGVDNFDANACEDDFAVNLFQFIGSSPNPQLFGTWSDDSGTGALVENIFDATLTGPGTYDFTYTVPAIGSCPAQSVQVELTVQELPDPGNGGILTLCGIGDLSNYTAIDLTNYIFGGDPGGYFSDESGTAQIDNFGDLTINAQEIFDNFGYGRYSFSYTVLPSHPVCTYKSTSFTLEILQKIDLGDISMSVNSLCEDDVGIVDLEVLFDNVPDLPEILNWDYDFEYEIFGPITYSDTISVNLNSPSFGFALPPDFVPTPGNYTMLITDITVTDDDDNIICDIIFNLTANFEIRELPDIEDAEIDIPDICLGENATVSIDDPSINGSIDLTYTLSGANSFTETIPADFSDGNHTFTLDSSLLTTPGTTVFTITYIVDDMCETSADVSVNFEVNPLPNTSAMEVLIDDTCFGEPVQVILLNLIALDQIQISYEITGANPSPSQTENLVVSNGTAGFILPASQFPNVGTSVFELTYVVNTITGCENAAQVTDDFEIFPLPAAPMVSGPLEFCETENPTVADLLPNGTDFFWFADQSGTTALDASTPLVSGTYWVGTQSPQGCVSPKTSLSVSINVVPPLTLIPDGENFCGAENPTIADLTQNANQSGNTVISWFDANGNELDPDYPLAEGEIYYGFISDLTTNCQSSSALEVSVSLTDCSTIDPEEEYDFFVPDAFSPNNDGVNDVFRILNIQFIFPDYKYEIYNRWGKLLFVGDSDKPEWNGKTAAGNTLVDGIVPNGVYFYVIYFNKENVSPKQGSVYLNR